MSTQCVECDKYIQGQPENPVCKNCSDKADTEPLKALEHEKTEKKLTCYFRKNSGYQCEEVFESKTLEAIKRRNQLRKHGYCSNIYRIGYTTVVKGLVLTLVITGTGEHEDTYGIPIGNLELMDVKNGDSKN